jgi:hypothetical protein
VAFNPFDPVSNELLQDYALSLALGCGRAKSILHNPRKAHLCGLLQIAESELTKRGLPHPTPPYYSGRPPKA